MFFFIIIFSWCFKLLVIASTIGFFVFTFGIFFWLVGGIFAQFDWDQHVLDGDFFYQKRFCIDFSILLLLLLL